LAARPYREGALYVGGFNAVRSITRRTDAKFYHSFADDAVKIASEQGWADEMDGALKRAASYNQFRNVINLFRPMFFGHAIQVILSCECALEEAIRKERYTGNPVDVYGMMKVIPACYNIDGFNEEALKELRDGIDDFDLAVLSGTGQRSANLLDLLADGHCVTRKTARIVRAKTLELLDAHPKVKVKVGIGDVRGRPGKKLGRKGATTGETIELDNFTAYAD
jgi:hypothetical protein